MKHLWNNLITSSEADSEDSEFPATALLNRSPKRIWKAVDGIYTATLTVETSGGVTDILIAGTNAISASIIGSDPNGASWAEADGWAEGDTWVSPEVNISGSAVQRSRSQAMWIELLTSVDVPAQLKITLTCDSSETLYAGVIVAGIPEEYGGCGPLAGMKRKPRDLSIKNTNSRGGKYYGSRDKLRTYSLEAIMTKDSAETMFDIFDDIGELGAGWKLSRSDNNNYVVYAGFEGEPEESEIDVRHSRMTWFLVEEL